jgi:hypothetical protein
MGLNDEREKLRQAKQWLTEYPAGSEHFDAAREHVLFIRRSSRDVRLRREAQEIVYSILEKVPDLEEQVQSQDYDLGLPAHQP